MWRTGSVAPRHVGSSRTRARTRVPCTGRRILSHCATREVPVVLFLWDSTGLDGALGLLSPGGHPPRASAESHTCVGLPMRGSDPCTGTRLPSAGTCPVCTATVCVLSRVRLPGGLCSQAPFTHSGSASGSAPASCGAVHNALFPGSLHMVTPASTVLMRSAGWLQLPLLVSSQGPTGSGKESSLQPDRSGHVDGV